MDSSTKILTHCAAAVKRANSKLGITGKAIKNKTASLVMPLYKTTVWPHLKYCSQFWSPYLNKIAELGKLQRRETKMMGGGLEHLSYQERPANLGLFGLEKTQLRGDVIEIYQIIHQLEKVDKGSFFSLFPIILDSRGT